MRIEELGALSFALLIKVLYITNKNGNSPEISDSFEFDSEFLNLCRLLLTRALCRCYFPSFVTEFAGSP